MDLRNFKVVNLTTHAVNLNDGTVYPTTIAKDGKPPRVSQSWINVGDRMFSTAYGEVEGLPQPTEGTLYIVPALILNALPDRKDLVAPATNHPDTIRNELGHIVSVPGFVTNL